MNDIVRAVLEGVERTDRDGLGKLLHPYPHWTCADGTTIRGRERVLAHLEHDRACELPMSHELRDGRIYRWIEPARPR